MLAMVGIMELAVLAAPVLAIVVPIAIGWAVIRHFRRVGQLEGQLEERRRRDRDQG